jgi:2-methylisocitrate lyase-like PEP mutase family enzyme
MTPPETQQAKARTLRRLADGEILVLPNAWDPPSAALITAAGAEAIATTSGGVSWTLGRPDGQRLTRDEMVAAVARIVEVVEIPVSADVEGGYGDAPEDVARTVEAIIGAGAVGMNLEDSRAPGGPLFSADEHAARLQAARDAAQQAGLPELVINARTDVFLFEIGDPGDRVADVLARSAAYKAAGADSLFVPGLLDLGTLAEIAAASGLPINAMAGAGAPGVEELRAAGVRRVTVGTAIAQAAYGLARRATAELLATGTYDALEDAAPFGELNGLGATKA